MDLKGELEFLEAYDAAYQAVIAVVDMPNRRAGLLVRLWLQNSGCLSKNKCKQFAELSDEEIRRMEVVVQEILRSSGDAFAAPDGE